MRNATPHPHRICIDCWWWWAPYFYLLLAHQFMYCNFDLLKRINQCYRECIWGCFMMWHIDCVGLMMMFGPTQSTYELMGSSHVTIRCVWCARRRAHIDFGIDIVINVVNSIYVPSGLNDECSWTCTWIMGMSVKSFKDD